MVTAAYIGYAAVQLVLLASLVRLFARHPHWVLVPFLINVFGLAYDNLAVGAGQLIGPGPLLMALSVPRYAIHALTTPLYGLVGLHLARHAGVRWAQGRGMLIVFTLITLPALALGIYTDLIVLHMEPVVSMGTLRYANASASGPPLPSIAAIIMLIACGIGVAIHTRWPWLLLGALVMFVMAGAAAKVGVISNFGEIAMVAGMVATGYRFLPLSAPAARPAPVGGA
jgi:hypothetical protein